MAIAADAVIDVFGTADDLGSSSAAVVDAAFSIASDVAQWTNDDDVDGAAIVLDATWATAPDANSSVTLYGRLMNISGTSDQPIPTANFPHKSMGRFPVKDITTQQLMPIDIDLPNVYTSQVYEFYLKNSSGQTMSAGWKLLITPKTAAPHA